MVRERQNIRKQLEWLKNNETMLKYYPVPKLESRKDGFSGESVTACWSLLAMISEQGTALDTCEISIQDHFPDGDRLLESLWTLYKRL